MAELNIQYYKANDLIMAEYNPRQLTRDQYAQLKDSLTRFGLVDPLIVNKHKDRKNILVGGHQRLKIAKEMGIHDIPCVEVELPYDQEKELNIRLNKNIGEWDWDALANYFDVGELTEWGFSDRDLMLYDDSGDLKNEDDWVGMPEFEGGENPLQLIISFENIDDRAEFVEKNEIKVRLKGEQRSWSTWYPYKDRADVINLKYEEK